MGRRNLVRWRGGVARQTPKPRAGGGRWTAAPWRPELLGDVETAGFERRGETEATVEGARNAERLMLSLFGLVRVKMQNVNRFASYDSTA
jgi:hypothetical protein